MNRYRKQLSAALEAARIVSPNSAEWLGSPIPESWTSVAIGGGRAALTGRLAAVLYQCFYATGEPVPLDAWRPSTASRAERSTFAASLCAAAPAPRTIEPGWRLVGKDGQRAILRRGGLTLAASRRSLIHAAKRSLRPGDEVPVWAPAVRFGVAPGHVTLVGPAPPRPPAAEPDARFYWNVSAQHAPALLTSLAGGLAERGVPFVLKSLDDPEAYARCDAAVLLLARSDVARAAPILRRLCRGGWWQRSDRVPALTRSLGPGLSTADAPPGGASYGETRCSLVAAAIVDSFFRSERRVGARLARVERHFGDAGIDAARPHLEPASRDLRGVRSVVGTSRRSRRGRDRPGRRPLDVAAAIARNLCDRALGDETSCSWLDREVDLQHRDRGRSDASCAFLGPDLYGGTAGVGLFLAHWARRSGNPRARHTARRAVHHALMAARDPRRAPAGGLYAGWVGVAWAATHVGLLLGDGALVASARGLIRRRLGEPAPREDCDLITGKAGLLLGLLILGRLERVPGAVERAVSLGDELVRASRGGPGSRSWRTPGSATPHDLLGLAHGAAGMAHALFELHAATGASRFGKAAAQAIRYERRHFDRRAGNWPDRRGPIGQSRTGTPKRFMTAWCHGAGGIGLARLHVWRSSADAEALAETRVALRAVRRALAEWSGDRVEDYSLCHGLGGLAIFAREAAIAGLPHVPAGRNLAADWFDRWDPPDEPNPDLRWRAASPGLFVGAAGVGYAALALAGEPLPPILLPRWPRASQELSR